MWLTTLFLFLFLRITFHLSKYKDSLFFCVLLLYLQEAVDEAKVLCHAGRQNRVLLGAELGLLHGTLNLNKRPVHVRAKDLAACGEVEHRQSVQACV